MVVATGEAEAIIDGPFELVPPALLHGLKGDDFSSPAFHDAPSTRDSEVVFVLLIRRSLLDQTRKDRSVGQANREVVLSLQSLNLGPVDPNVVQCITRLEIERPTFDSLDLSRNVVAILKDDPVIVPFG